MMRAIAIALMFITLACSKPQEDSLYRKSAVIMDTLVTVTVEADSPKEAEKAINAAFNEISRLEELLSFWSEESEIASVYHNAGIGPVKVSSDTIALIKAAQYVSEKSGGAFDATIGPVMRLWDFKKEQMPSPGQIKEKLPLVDYRQMQVDEAGQTAFLNVKGMSFDTGGIAKGYAVDRAVDKLKGLGIKAALVAIAGDIRGYGKRPDGEAWRVGIRNPRGEGEDAGVMAVVELVDMSISTSGDYERYFTKDGVRYHHILEPTTGMPARGFMSVSVLAPEAVMADGFSTAVFVLGPERGRKALESLGMEGVMVTDRGERIVTEGIKSRVEWKESE